MLLSVINRGAGTLIVDMTATISCDHAGADALARVHRRASASGTELRLTVTAQIVRRFFGISGVDRLVPIDPFLEAATAASAPKVPLPLPAGSRTAITPAVMWTLIDALQDGMAVADGDGMLTLANQQMDNTLREIRDTAFPGRGTRGRAM